MVRTFYIIASLGIVCSVNAIICWLRNLPLVGKKIPVSLYSNQDIKTVMKIFAVIKELVLGYGFRFIGYMFAYLIPWLLWLLREESQDVPRLLLENQALVVLIGILLILTIWSGGIIRGDEDTFYAVIQLRMDARAFTLSMFCYLLFKKAVVLLIMALVFFRHLPVQGILLLVCFALGSACAAGACSYAFNRRYYEDAIRDPALRSRMDRIRSGMLWVKVFLTLVILGGLAWMLFGKLMFPSWLLYIIMGLGSLAGVPGMIYLYRQQDYYLTLRGVLYKSMTAVVETQSVLQDTAKKEITEEKGISSDKQGFAFLNDLFMKRHKGMFRTSMMVISLIIAAVTGILVVIMILSPGLRAGLGTHILELLRFFVFVMYLINGGQSFTRALYMNCDRSLLHYSFYTEPDNLLKLFKLRLVEICRSRLLPALLITGGLMLLAAIGGRRDPMVYLVIALSIPAMSIFFSVHYLTLYYLFQPFDNSGKSVKPAYNIIIGLTYFVSYFLMRIELEPLGFAIVCIAFCIAYSIIACMLVYRYAAKTFKPVLE
ncbi:MAG: hypothetical protein II627_04665 [Lachnospiraceae bacterium]|nr:hypothetical protein [Lachnospiraceae bacterium]